MVNLQTNFGGGKTHSMLALWHLLSGTPLTTYPDELQKLLGGMTAAACGARVALVGNHIAAGKGSAKPDGTQVQTLWGELAWQLGSAGGRGGGAAGLRDRADADATAVQPRRERSAS